MKTKEIHSVTKNLGRVIAKNSPSILTGLGVAGVLTTTIMAVKATPKALQILAEKRRDLEWHEKIKGDNVERFHLPELSAKETVMLTWKCYIPTAIMGLATIGCIIGANSINLKRNAALATVYSLSEAALKEYQAKVVEHIGKPKEEKIKSDINKDKLQKNPVRDSEVILTGKGDTLCYDSIGGRYFKSDIEYIRRSINELNRMMLNEHFITLNEVYYQLGLEGTKAGDLLGWSVDNGLVETRFDAQLTESGTPCLVLDFVDEPTYAYRD